MKLKVRPKPAPQSLLPVALSQTEVWLKNARTAPLLIGPGATEALDKARAFIEIGEVLKSRSRQFKIAEPGVNLGEYDLFPGASWREIHGATSKVRAAFAEELDDDQFLDACKTSFSQLEIALREAQSLDKPAASLTVSRLLEEAGLITIRQNAPSLKRG